MKDQLSLLGIEFENVETLSFKKYYNNDGNLVDGKKIIKELFTRRNEIAHQSDRNHFNATKNDITKEYVRYNINAIKHFVETIHHYAVSKSNE
ncbi:MAG: hypothetical protein E7183_04290 [Erysipelotrichaceae bacterium]|nr:hypothetical protein [Erysipelotrichaceae bacterium]